MRLFLPILYAIPSLLTCALPPAKAGSHQVEIKDPIFDESSFAKPFLFDYLNQKITQTQVIGKDVSLNLVRVTTLPSGAYSSRPSDFRIEVILPTVINYGNTPSPFPSKGYTIYDTSVSQWNKEIIIKNVPPSTNIILRFWKPPSTNILMRFLDYWMNTLVGEAVLENVQSMPTGSDIIIPVTNKDTMFVTIRVDELGETENPTLPTRRDGPNYWRRYSSKLARFLVYGWVDWITNKRAYHVYDVDLHGIPEIFGNLRTPYNKEYKWAQRFLRESDNPQTAALRKGLHLEYHRLNHPKSVEGGTIQSAREFFQLFDYGLDKNQPTIFTYIIRDGHFRFSRTGKEFVQDQISKHMLLSNGARDVLYAGELFVDVSLIKNKPTLPKVEGTNLDLSAEITDLSENIRNSATLPRLVIDNNSGTYIPDVNHLPRVVKLLKNNFPGITVQAFGYNDPKLKTLQLENDIDA